MNAGGQGSLADHQRHKRTQSNAGNEANATTSGAAKLKVTRDGGSTRAGKLGGGAVPGSASQALYSQRPPEARGNRNTGLSVKKGPAQAIAGEFSVLGTNSST